MGGVLPESLQPAAEELGGYFADSFGNATRIDYGTGAVRQVSGGLAVWSGGRQDGSQGAIAEMRMAAEGWHACIAACTRPVRYPPCPPRPPAPFPSPRPLSSTRRAGHETTFAALLYCLAKLGVVGQGDAQALVTRVFRRYLQLMRKIQVGRRVGFAHVLCALCEPPVILCFSS